MQQSEPSEWRDGSARWGVIANVVLPSAAVLTIIASAFLARPEPQRRAHDAVVASLAVTGRPTHTPAAQVTSDRLTIFVVLTREAAADLRLALVDADAVRASYGLAPLPADVLVVEGVEAAAATAAAIDRAALAPWANVEVVNLAT